MLRLLALSCALPLASSIAALVILRNVEEATSQGMTEGCYPGSLDDISKTACDIATGVPTLIMIGAAAAAFPICYVIVQWLLVQLVALHRTLFAAALPVLILLAFIASVMITLVQCGIVLSVANLISLHLGGSYNSYVTTMVLGAMFWMVLPNAWSFRPDFRVRRDPNPTDANQAVATHLPKNRIEKIAQRVETANTGTTKLKVLITPWPSFWIRSSPETLWVSKSLLPHLTPDEFDALIARALCEFRCWNVDQRQWITRQLWWLGAKVYRFAQRAFFDAPAAAILTELHRSTLAAFTHLSQLNEFDIDRATAKIISKKDLARALLKPGLLTMHHESAVQGAYSAFDTGLIIRNLEAWTARRIGQGNSEFLETKGLETLSHAIMMASTQPHIFSHISQLESRLFTLGTSPADLRPIQLNLGNKSIAAELGLSEGSQYRNRFAWYGELMDQIQDRDYRHPPSEDKRQMRLRHALAYVAAASSTALNDEIPTSPVDADPTLFAYLIQHPEDVPEAEYLPQLLSPLLDVSQLEIVVTSLRKLSESEVFGNAYDFIEEFQTMATRRALAMQSTDIMT
jgi:hypothetical protein